MSEGLDLAEWLARFLRDPAFLERYPFYAAILARLAPVADPSVKRMAVSLHDGRFYLHVNVESFLSEPRFLRGVLLHEVHHVALGHLTHPKFADVDEPELCDLALEMSANEYIEEPLPDPIVWKPYADLGLRAGQSTMERYRLLVAASRAGRRDDLLRPRDGDATSRRVDDHRFLRLAERDGGTVERTRQLLQGSIDEVRGRTGSREDVDPKRDLVAGLSPGRLVEELTGVRGEAEVFVDWKTALAMFVARARAPVHTWARPSRRFPARAGEVPGRTWAPRAIARPSLLVAIDTSMSMSSKELEEIARHLATMTSHARLVVAECDTEITRTYPFEGVLAEVQGRGGTDLRPVFDRAFLGSQKVDGVVYFTDGDGPLPEEPPPLPVLWVTTKPRDLRCPWGVRASIARRAPKPTTLGAKPRKKP